MTSADVAVKVKIYKCKNLKNSRWDRVMRATSFLADPKKNAVVFWLDTGTADEETIKKNPYVYVIAELPNIKDWEIAEIDKDNLKTCPHCNGIL